MQNAVKKTSVCKLNLAHGNKANYPLGKSPGGENIVIYRAQILAILL